ncbi:MAG: hypothetical protein ACFFBR_00600 [Promethearchaeota archaeon]
MRWFKRKKSDETKQQTTPQARDDDFSSTPSPMESVLPETSIVSLTNPVEAYIQRLDELLADPDVSEKTKALKDTRLQLIVGGEPLLMKKEGVQPMGLVLERSIQSDVFIRISEEAAGALAMTTSLLEFKKTYKKMIGVKGEAAYVSIKLHTPLEDLRAKGYFSVELLRILIDA